MFLFIITQSTTKLMSQEIKETGVASVLGNKRTASRLPEFLPNADSRPGPSFSLHSDSNNSLFSSPCQTHKSTSPSGLIAEVLPSSRHKVTIPLCLNVGEAESLKSSEAEKGWRRSLENGKGRAEIADNNNKAMKVIARKGKHANVWLKGKLMNPRCHYCCARDKRANHLLCARNPKCKVNFCFPCLRKWFDIDPEAQECSSWICLVCANECICIKCRKKRKEKALKLEQRGEQIIAAEKHKRKKAINFVTPEPGEKRYCQSQGNNSGYLSLSNERIGHNFTEARKISEAVMNKIEGDKALNRLIKLEEGKEQKHKFFKTSIPKKLAESQPSTVSLPCDPNKIFLSLPLVDQQRPYSAIPHPKFFSYIPQAYTRRQYGSPYQLQGGCTHLFNTAASAQSGPEAGPQTGAGAKGSIHQNLSYAAIAGLGAANFGYGSCFVPQSLQVPSFYNRLGDCK